jgi:CheY-like chemotaxis protein
MADDGMLYWSRRGEIACARHAPVQQSSKWTEELWQPMPDFGVRMAKYQCQHCEGVPLRVFRRLDGRTPLILNVDDRPASLYLRTRALREHGFTVTNAESGEAALLEARRLRPHLVLLDVHLPDIDGREVCARLKKDTSTAEIPVLLISSTLQQHGEEAEELARSTADAYLAEPVAPEELASTVRRLLRVDYPR